MTRRVMGMIGVVLLLVALAIGWKLRGRGDHDAATSGAQGGGTGTSSTSGHGNASAETRRGDVVPATVSGRVTQRVGGAGIAGAHVSLSHAELGAQFFDAGAQPTIAVTTDAQGAWTASGVAPGRYAIAATAKGFIPALHDVIVVGSGQRQTGIDIVLDAGGLVLSGVVSDFGGGPVAGARVSLDPKTGKLFDTSELVTFAGDDGRYEITLAPGAYTAVASHEDYTTAQHSFKLTDKPQVADFTLTPGATIRGTVVTRDGTPVPDALVSAEGRQRDEGGSTTSDASGAFTLKSLGSGSIALTASSRGHASSSPTVVDLGIGEQIDGVRVIVDRAYTIAGTVVEKGTTKGIPGARLGVFSMAGGEKAFARAPSAEDGTFVIDGVRPSSYMLFALGSDVMPEIGKPVEVVDRDITNLVIEMAVGVTVSGRVDPPAVASIGISPTVIGIGNIFEVVKTVLVQGKSDQTGAFTLEHVPSGTFHVTATAEDGQSAGKVIVAVGSVSKTDVVIPLERRSSLAGKVLDARGGPVAGVGVRAVAVRDKAATVSIDVSQSGFDYVSTGSDGAFKIVGLDEGTFHLTVDDDGGPMKWADAAHRDKPREPISFDVAKGADRGGIVLTVETSDGVIRGSVVGADRKPAADSWVTATLVEPSSETRILIRGENGGENHGMVHSESKPVLTGADGTFVIDRLHGGEYTVVAEAARGTSRAQKSGIKTGETVTLVLEPLGTLTGTVTAGGAPVTRFDLSCDRGSGGGVDRHVTDPTGAYKLERLPPAEYTCSATADAGRARATVKVPAGDAKLDLVLAPWASLTGTVVSVITGQPVPGVVLLAGIGKDFDAKALGDMLGGGGPKSDAAGRFVVNRVAPGKGELAVMPAGGQLQQLAMTPYEVKDGQRLDLGVIKVVPPRTGEAGTLGMSTEIVGETLTVTSVKPGGPAAAAGVQVGDRIAAINGTPIAAITAKIAQTVLASGTVGIGQAFQLGLDRGGTAVPISIAAIAW